MNYYKTVNFLDKKEQNKINDNFTRNITWYRYIYNSNVKWRY